MMQKKYWQHNNDNIDKLFENREDYMYITIYVHRNF